MSYRPRLRDDLLRAVADDGRQVLRDPLTRVELALDETSLTLLGLLDGTLDLAGLAARLPALEPEAVTATVRRLLLLNFLDGAGASTLELLRALRDGRHALPYAVLREGRFACQGSGACCRGYAFCPVDDQDIARIEALPVRERLPHVGDQDFFDALDLPSGRRMRFLHAVDEQCVFLLPEGLCGLHVAFGSEAKPRICRIYPYHVLNTIYGVKIYDQGECSRFATSARAGTHVTEDIDRIAGLVGPPTTLYHPMLHLGDGTMLDYGYFLALQKRLVAEVEAADGPALPLLAVACRRIAHVFDALQRCPLAQGEPERTLETALATPLPAVAPELAVVRRGAAALAALCAELVEVLARCIRDHRFLARKLIIRQMCELIPILHGLQAIAHARAEGAAPHALHDDWRGLPCDDAELTALFRISFRQTLFGDFLTVDEHPRAGLLRLLLTTAVTLCGGAMQARADGRERIAAGDFDFGHNLALRVLRRKEIGRRFIAHEETVWDAAAALPTLWEV